MDFRIHIENNNDTNTNNAIRSTNFDIRDFKSIYEDEFIELIWNPLYDQPQFKILKNSNNFVRGGYKILNFKENSIFTFQFENNNNDEYFFSSNDGTSININTGYNFISNWNRSKLWLSSVFDIDFPYYNISINNNSFNAVAIIEKYII